jgi:hypothetical protein
VGTVHKTHRLFCAGNPLAALVSMVTLNIVVTRDIFQHPDKSDVTGVVREVKVQILSNAPKLLCYEYIRNYFCLHEVCIIFSQDTTRFYLYFPFPHVWFS